MTGGRAPVRLFIEAPLPRAGAFRRRLGRTLTSLGFCGPAVFLYAGFVILPAVLGFTYGFTNWSGWRGGGGADDLARAAGQALCLRGEEAAESLEEFLGAEFVGFENFRALADDPPFASAVRFTLFETVLVVVTFTLAAMVLAVLLDGLRRVKGLVRGLFFYPYILSLLVSSLLFMYLANYREGAMNRILQAVGLGALRQDWMMGPEWAPWFVFALVAWSGMGFFTTLYLANLQTIPTDLYEAARIDGAGTVAIFTNIQFPMLMPTLMTNSVLALIVGINLFPQIVITTEGGPGTTTYTIGYYIYRLGRLMNRQGYASAVSFVAFVALVVVALVQVALMRRKQVQL